MQTLFRSLSKTFRSVITPSWLTGLVKTVKETAKAEDTVPTKKVSYEYDKSSQRDVHNIDKCISY